MEKFIEVTDYDDGTKMLLPIDKIITIESDGSDSVFISMLIDSDSTPVGVYVAESYEEIKAKLIKSE